MNKEEKKALRYNKNKLKWSLVDFKALEPMVKVLMYGAHKYSIYENYKHEEIKGCDITIEESAAYTIKSSGANNWKLGLDKTELLESMQRHLIDLFEGKELDNESKLEIIGHLMCNCMFYSYFNQK